MRNPACNGARSAAVYQIAIQIAGLLAEGRCVPHAEMELVTQASRNTVGAAVAYLQQRGIRVSYWAKGRCWYVDLQAIDLTQLRVGALTDLGLVPDDELALLRLAAGSSARELRRAQNPSSSLWAKNLARRLANP